MSQRMLRGMAAGLGALVSLGSMAGCGTDGQVQKATSIKIGVTVYDQYDTFVSQMMTDFNEYAAEQEEHTGIAINVEVYNAAGSQSTQNSQVEEMLDAGCNVICVNLVDRTEPTTIIDMAEKNNVPVIFFNRELVEEDLERWDRVYYVGAKAFESGIMQGEIAADAFKENPDADKNGDGVFQYVVLEGEAGASRCDRAHRVCGLNDYRQRRGGGKARVRDCELEPGAGADQDDADACGI